MHQGLVLVGQLFENIDARRWEALPRFFSTEVTYERPGYEPLVGLDQVLDFYRRVRVIETGRHILEQVVFDDDGRGACWGRFVGVHKNGAPLDERFADVYTLAAGKIATRRSYFFRPAV